MPSLQEGAVFLLIQHLTLIYLHSAGRHWWAGAGKAMSYDLLRSPWDERLFLSCVGWTWGRGALLILSILVFFGSIWPLQGWLPSGKLDDAEGSLQSWLPAAHCCVAPGECLMLPELSPRSNSWLSDSNSSSLCYVLLCLLVLFWWGCCAEQCETCHWQEINPLHLFLRVIWKRCTPTLSWSFS